MEKERKVVNMDQEDDGYDCQEEEEVGSFLVQNDYRRSHTVVR
jgi:hypothetical protein